MYHIPKDRRALRSASCLFQGLKLRLKSKAFKEITVSDLQKASGVSRSTFYRLFDNPADILEWKLDSCFDQLLESIPENQHTLDLAMVRHFFTYWTSQLELLDLLDEVRQPFLIPRAIARFGDRIQGRFDDCIISDPVQDRYFQSMRFGMLMGFMRTWMDNGHKESVDQMLEIFYLHLYHMGLLGQKLGVYTVDLPESSPLMDLTCLQAASALPDEKQP